MEVHVVNPHGYCLGVRAAIATALKAKEDYPGHDVYLLGLLVHNEEAVAALSGKGLIPLDETKRPLLDYLLERKEGDVIVFSAHGHPESYEDLAKEKGLILIDATCTFVTENLRAGKESKRPVLYVGVEGHLESEAFLANCPDATFYDTRSGRCNFLALKAKREDPLIITQTTLSYAEVEKAMADIRFFFPNAEIAKQRCLSTSLRQDALRSLPEGIEAVIVLGSKRSNNSVKLYEIARSQNYPTYLCLGLDEVKALDLSDKKRLALCSGASTSDETFQAVLTYLRQA